MNYQERRARRSYVRNRNTVRHASMKSGFGPITNTLVLALIIGVMGLLYLTQITKTSVYGYQVNELEQQLTELERDNQDLQVEAARLQSIERIKASQVAGKLVEPDELSFAE